MNQLTSFSKGKHYVILIALYFIIIGNTNAQNKIILQPGSTDGKNALIVSNLPNNNYAKHPDFAAIAWTFNNDPVDARSLIQFDLSGITEGAIINSAKLSLYSYKSPSNGEHSSMSGSNKSYLRRIIEPWSEQNITWNNQPASTDINQVLLPQSENSSQDYIDIDVTGIVADMLTEKEGNCGFVLQLADEFYFRRMVFASSGNSNMNLHPKLEIDFTVNLPPVAVINGSSSACSGSAIFLNANSSYLPNQTIADLEYQWRSNTMVISNNSLNELMLVAPKVESTTQIEFYLQVFNNDLGSEIDTFIVTVIPAPATPSIEQFADTLLATLANSYQWYNDGSEVNGATDSTLTIDQSGNYQVKIINEWGCVSDISVPVAFTKTSINTNSNQVKVFPNPTNDIINIVGLDQSKTVSVFVYDQLGHLSDQVTSENGIAIIDLKQQKRGIYFIQIENQQEPIKILKE